MTEWIFHLYVAGRTPTDRRALHNLQVLCDMHLHGHCRIDVIDLYEQPDLASEHQILAVPTVVRVSPLPVRKVIGDLSIEDLVIEGLDLGAER